MGRKDWKYCKAKKNYSVSEKGVQGEREIEIWIKRDGKKGMAMKGYKRDIEKGKRVQRRKNQITRECPLGKEKEQERLTEEERNYDKQS